MDDGGVDVFRILNSPLGISQSSIAASLKNRERIQPSQSDTWSSALRPHPLPRCRLVTSQEETFLLYGPVTGLLATMSNLSKDEVQRKPKLRDKLKDGFKDGFNKLTARLSPAPSPQPSRTSTPDPSAQRESSNTRGKAGGGKCLHLDCQQGLMNYTQSHRGRCPSQRL